MTPLAWLLVGLIADIAVTFLVLYLLSYRPVLYVNGLRQAENTHYLYNPTTRAITFIINPAKGDVMMVAYERRF